MDQLPAEFTARGAEPADVLTGAEAGLGIALPDDYKTFLARHGGGEGFIGAHYVVLWSASELQPFNADYEFAVHAPGLMGFGGDGGGELFAFDTRRAPYAVVIVPCILSLDDAKAVATSFDEFLVRLSRDSGSLIT